MSSGATTSVTAPTMWEGKAAQGWHLGLSIAAVVAAAVAIFFVPVDHDGSLSTIRVALMVLIVIFSAIPLVIKYKSDSAKEARKGAYTDARGDAALDFSNCMATALDSLAHALRDGVSKHTAESFLGECAELVLKLVGNENRVLRVCVYKLDGREDSETPDDDHLLELQGGRHGRKEWARPEFRYDEKEGKAAIDELWRGLPVKYPNLHENAPPYHTTAKKYVAFYSIPVMERGKLKGMISCDSSKLDVLGERHEEVLQMVATLVGIGIKMMREAAQVTRPADTEGVGR